MGVSHRHRERQRAFTLLELLVSIAILALAAGMIVPRFINSITARTLEFDVRGVVSMLRAAHAEAITTGEEVAVTIDHERRMFVVDGTTPSMDWPDGLGASLEASDAGLKPRDLRFFADGSSTGGRLVLSKTERSFAISVDWLTGRVYLDD